MPDTHIEEIPRGAGLRTGAQFIRQLVVEDPEQVFGVDLTGAVRACDGAVAHAILPVARLVLHDGQPPYREALVTAAVADEQGLDREVSKLADGLGTIAPRGFGVRFSAGDRSFGSIVTLAEHAIGGECCCDGGGDGGGAAPGGQVRGAISVGLAAGAKDKLRWSKPVAARIRAWIDDDGAYGPLDKAASVCSWFFDCYSEWEGIFRRRTRCYGSCPGTQICQCGRTARGTPKVFCRGWAFCFCRT